MSVNEEQEKHRRANEAAKVALLEAQEIRQTLPAIPNDDTVLKCFSHLSLLCEESRRNENVWRAPETKLADLMCVAADADAKQCNLCGLAMRTRDYQRYCKKKALDLVDRALESDELRKIDHGWRAGYVLHHEEEEDDLFSCEDPEEPHEKLSLYPIGDGRNAIRPKLDEYGDEYSDEETEDGEDGDDEDGGEDEDDALDDRRNIQAFLSSQTSGISIQVATALLNLFPSDTTPALCVDYSYDNLICDSEEGTFYPKIVLVVTDKVGVVYVQMHFHYEWQD